MRTLFVNGHVYSLAEHFATAMLIDDDVIAWIGAEGGAAAHIAEVDEVVDLSGDLLAPGFVHLADSAPSAADGFVHGVSGVVTVANRWTPQQWEAATDQPVAVVPRDPCQLRTRISRGAPTALVPEGTDGWACIREAVHGITDDERISARAAFSALTRGAWRLLGRPDAGVLAVGADASFVRWHTEHLLVETPDDRISNWSTDPRSATPGLPPLADDSEVPTAVGVWVSGLPL